MGILVHECGRGFESHSWHIYFFFSISLGCLQYPPLDVPLHQLYAMYHFAAVSQAKILLSPRRGIEPRSPAWQAGILTTILSRMTCIQESVYGMSSLIVPFPCQLSCRCRNCVVFRISSCCSFISCLQLISTVWNGQMNIWSFEIFHMHERHPWLFNRGMD